MATALTYASITPHLNSHHRCVIFSPKYHSKVYRVGCKGQNPTNNSSTKQESKPENALLKVAWYSSELLGIAASLFRSPSSIEAPEKDVKLATDGSGVVDRALVVDNIKEDFERSYFVTGNLTLDAYEDDCEFADPAGSFRGLRRFKRNCTNFGSLIEKSNMKLMRWEDFEDKGVGHWRFSCVMSFPWRPILSATGYTEYYFGTQSGKVCRHVEHWNVPKMTLLKQLLKPSRGFWEGVCYAKKDYNLSKHPEIDVPNLQVIKLMQSFKSKEYVRETFAWMHYYWYLTNEGIEFLRTNLNLPSEIVPNKLKRQARPPPPGGRPAGDRLRGPSRFEGDRPRFGDRDEYRGGPRGPPGEFGDKGGAPADYQPAFWGPGGRSGFGRGGGSYGAGPASGSFA